MNIRIVLTTAMIALALGDLALPGQTQKQPVIIPAKLAGRLVKTKPALAARTKMIAIARRCLLCPAGYPAVTIFALIIRGPAVTSVIIMILVPCQAIGLTPARCQGGRIARIGKPQNV